MRGKNPDVPPARHSGSVSIIESIYRSFAHVLNMGGTFGKDKNI